jgi:hypothetical protein
MRYTERYGWVPSIDLARQASDSRQDRQARKLAEVKSNIKSDTGTGRHSARER